MFPIIFSRVLTTVVASVITEKIMKQFNKKVKLIGGIKMQKIQDLHVFLRRVI